MLEIFQIIFYDLVILFCQSIIHTFFRDIKVRGSFNIPSKGPIIFVIGPHHNQFLDGAIVISKVKQFTNRRISFLIADKSYKRRFIGFMARLTSAIPVQRAQDMLKNANGRIKLKEGTKDIIIGHNTYFTKDCEVKGLIGLPRSKGNFQILSIESDTELKIKPVEKDDQIEILTKGTAYKIAPHVDNDKLFSNVFEFLNSGKVLGMFPEGGSHDRTDLLPLKPGVAIMALGAMASNDNSPPNDVINVIPVGMNYFHPHRFRSRAVVEFGEPIKITKELGQKYEENKRLEVQKLMDYITLSLKQVCVTCDDYDTLIVLQAARRLFTNESREKIPLPLVVEMNRRFIKGYQLNKDKPDIIDLKESVMEYQKKLMMLGLHDYQVNIIDDANFFKNLQEFSWRLFRTVLFFCLSLPGTILFSPVFIISSRISKEKQAEALANSTVKIKAKDVLGTWKVLVALVIAPCLYIFYSVLGTLYLRSTIVGTFPTWIIFIFCYFWSVLTTYASLRIGESGMDYYKSLIPLFYSLSKKKARKQIGELKQMRLELSDKVTQFCNNYGPDIFQDYEEFYDKYNNAEDDDGELSLKDVQIFDDSESSEPEHSDYDHNEAEETKQDVRLLSEKINKAYKTRMKLD